MKKSILLLLCFYLLASITYSQSIDDQFSQKKMLKDLEVFRQIRQQANSGLYKYRTKKEIDSIYTWAEEQIRQSSTYIEFYTIICKLTDFEGSLHNNTNLPEKYWDSMQEETYGYFPYPIKWIDGEWRINFEQGEIPLGATIVSINSVPIEEIMDNLNLYYTTDGINTTGKRIGMRRNFPRYYRWFYGLRKEFQVSYREENSKQTKDQEIESIGYRDYYRNFTNRFSKPVDQIYYKDLDENEKYKYEQIDSETAILTVHTFAMGNEEDEEHQIYARFLDSVFTSIDQKKLKNLIVDMRHNGGGTDPNDMVTYSYLTQRDFQENTQAWISFKKIPYLKYIYTKIPRFLRPFGVGKYNRSFQEDFYVEKDNRFYQGPLSGDQKIRTPQENAFTGTIYLLTSPAIASAGSMFSAMVAGNENTIVVGEETMGTYYGHNGHTPLGYILPKSKIEIFFSVVNLEQDVVKEPNQKYNRGIMPDYQVTQSYEDYLKHTDTQKQFTLDLIKDQ